MEREECESKDVEAKEEKEAQNAEAEDHGSEMIQARRLLECHCLVRKNSMK